VLFNQRLLTALAVVALLVAGTYAALAQPGGNGQGADFFDRLDTNKDGKIDADEFKGPDEAFARMDANDDGAITRDELTAGGDQAGGLRARQRDVDPAQRWQTMLQRFDANQDGKISSEEFQGRQEVLRFLDANNDNVITEEEALQAGNRTRNQGGDRGQMDPAQRWQRLIENCDANEDGKISAEEWPGRAEGFARFDQDGDGVLVQDELGQRPGAQQGGDRPARMDPALVFIQMMDESGDGQVSEEEWGNFFSETDVNEDGMLSHTELFAKIQATLRPPQDQGPVEEPAPPAEGF